MLDMLKHYTLEQLQDTDIDLLLPLYSWYCKKNSSERGQSAADDDIVYRNGKPYRVKKDASWA